MKAGKMNGLESDYATHLELLRRAGEVSWFEFEAVTLKLAPRTTYTPDFAVVMANGETQYHDCKGGPIEPQAAVKLKLSAEKFTPYRFFVIRKRGGAWTANDVRNGL